MSEVNLSRPSTWFSWHSWLFGSDKKVLDIACGGGRHAIAAAALGCRVTAIDADSSRFAEARQLAEERNLSIEWVEGDLEKIALADSGFDVTMVFNYLDRDRFEDIRNTVKVGGHLLYETFLTWQLNQGWGPKSKDHLLEPGELARLIKPWELIIGREVMEFVDGQPMAAASIVARRPPRAG